MMIADVAERFTSSSTRRLIDLDRRS